MEVRMKKVVFSIVMLLLMGLTFGCSNKESKVDNKTSNSSITTEEKKSEDKTDNTKEDKGTTEIKIGESNIIGEGKNKFMLHVEDGDGTKTDIEVSTDKETVGEALLELGVIQGDEGQYGLYVHTVCGKTYKYEVDKKHWAFYINDKYATTGVDSTPIKNGEEYSLKVQAE